MDLKKFDRKLAFSKTFREIKSILSKKQIKISNNEFNRYINNVIKW